MTKRKIKTKEKIEEDTEHELKVVCREDTMRTIMGVKHKANYPRVNTWRILPDETNKLMEVYCFLNIDYAEKISKYHYILNPENIDDFETVLNPDYDPDAKPDPYPIYCRKHISPACFDCDHSALCEFTGFDDDEED